MSPLLANYSLQSLHPLQQILSQPSLDIHFQPIVSVKRKALIGVEALVRAKDPQLGTPLPPPKLFEWAREQGCLLELDQLCQSSALSGFATLPALDPELLIFMNVEASLLDQGPALSLLHAVQQAGVKPSNVVIEINETEVLDQGRLAEFVQRHRAQGFLIAMDDLGSGHSGLQRWPVLKPDIIKLDRSIVDGVAGNFFAQELMRSLIALGRQTGALILAEGVETQADVTACLDLGVDLFQGYFFARPAAVGAPNLDQALITTLECAGRHKERTLARMTERRSEYQLHSQLARLLAAQLCSVPVAGFEGVLSGLPSSEAIESMLVLDERGVQASPTVFSQPLPGAARASLFQASKPGTDHSDRDYYYALTDTGGGRDFFLTEPHLSTASGHLCRTLSHVFKHANGENFVACFDLRVA